MSVRDWCKRCQTFAEKCANESSHRAGNSLVKRADVVLGAKRLRKLFRFGITQKEAEKWVILKQADFERGLFIPGPKKQTLASELADRYYQDHAQRHNVTPSNARWHVTLFKKVFQGRTIQSIERKELYSVQSELGKTRSAASVNRIFHTWRAIFNKGLEWEVVEKNPFDYLPALMEDDKPKRILTQIEVNKLFKNTNHKNLIDLMTVLLNSGGRPISIERCSWDNGDVDFTPVYDKDGKKVAHGTIWWVTYKGRRKHRYSNPINEALYCLLWERARATNMKGLVFDLSGVRMAATRAIRAAKINEGHSRTKKFTIYNLKHSYVTHLAMSGAKLEDAARLCGHTDLKMVIKHYSHLFDSYLAEVQNKAILTSPQFEVIHEEKKSQAS